MINLGPIPYSKLRGHFLQVTFLSSSVSFIFSSLYRKSVPLVLSLFTVLFKCFLLQTLFLPSHLMPITFLMMLKRQRFIVDACHHFLALRSSSPRSLLLLKGFQLFPHWLGKEKNSGISCCILPYFLIVYTFLHFFLVEVW